MPRRLNDAEREKRRREFLTDVDWDHQDLVLRLDAALATELAEFRRINEEAGLPGDEGEGAFERGFTRCALRFWDDLVYSFQMRRGAERGSRSTAHQAKDNQAGDDGEIRRSALAFRRSTPHDREHSTRWLAARVARKMPRRSAEAVRGALKRLGIK